MKTDGTEMAQEVAETSPEMQEAIALLEDLERRGLMAETRMVLEDVPLLARVTEAGLYNALLGFAEVALEYRGTW